MIGFLFDTSSHMPSVAFTVRSVLFHDMEAWRSLRGLLWPRVSNADQIIETQRLFAEQHRYAACMAISCDGARVGFAEAAVRHDYVNGCSASPVLFLEGIYVLPDVRRMGIASALCAALSQWGCERGCTEFASDTQLDNTHAQAWHRALGFEETERVVFFRKPLA